MNNTKEYTATYTSSTYRSFTVDGSEVANRVEKFMEDWRNSPLELLPLIEQVYLDGIKKGLALTGFTVTSCTENLKKEEI